MRLRDYLGLVPLWMIAVSGAVAAETMTLPRPDGSTIHWYLERDLAAARQGVLIVAQGSGCGSVVTNRNVEGAKALLPDFAKVTVEKYGVVPGKTQRSPTDCSPAFYAHHTVSQRAEDYRAVLNELKKSGWWNGQLVLFGGSEGGAVVQILAAEVQPNATVIFSAATGVPFLESFVRVLPPEAAAEVPSALEKARRDPLSAEVWGGNSYRWLADIMDRPLWEDALKVDGPILVVQGARDQSNPVSSARALRDAFAARGRANLTYWEYAEYDHGMADADGVSHLPVVLGRIADWLRTNLPARARAQTSATP